jgi:hypothetical protein
MAAYLLQIDKSRAEIAKQMASFGTNKDKKNTKIARQKLTLLMTDFFTLRCKLMSPNLTNDSSTLALHVVSKEVFEKIIKSGRAPVLL